PLRDVWRDHKLGLRAHRQPIKSTLHLGTLSCLQHFLCVLLPALYSRPLLTLLLNLAIQKVTSLEPRTPHQLEKTQKLSKNEYGSTLFKNYVNRKSASVTTHVFNQVQSVHNPMTGFGANGYFNLLRIRAR